jgi:hypothetical protein
MTKFNYNNCSKCGKISGVSVKGNKTTMEEVKDEVKRLEGINN